MPELPEVETIVRELAPRLRGRHIRSVEILQPRITRFCKHDLEQTLAGRKILDVHRHGKFIEIELDQGWLTIHLGMTGQIVFDAAPAKHTRAVLTLDDATVLYNDIRMFGSLEWTPERSRTRKLGPDALNAPDLPVQLLRRRAPIKAVLLNQSVFSGLGNIYADEALFRAGIHPRRHANRLSMARAGRLVAAIRELLAEAVEYRGSSISDYVDAAGRRGTFHERHRVYGRQGLPCVKCGFAIRKIVVAQRGTHYCANCQR